MSSWDIEAGKWKGLAVEQGAGTGAAGQAPAEAAQAPAEAAQAPRAKRLADRLRAAREAKAPRLGV